MRRTRAALAAAIFAGVFLLAGCGGDDDDTTAGGGTSTAAFNDADVAFAQGMIPHHRQAIEMAQLAADRAASDEVKALAADIEAAQGPEIETMTGWLQAWGQQAPEDVAGMDHGATPMPGMMSDADMQALERATDGGFDRMFLQMMIEHHQGAIEMARTEQADGQNTDAIALAEQVDTAQTAEIERIQDLLGS